MIARILLTGIALLLAIGGFFGAASMPPDVLSPTGILFLALSGVVWLGWAVFREACRDCPDIMMVRLAPLIRWKPPEPNDR